MDEYVNWGLTVIHGPNANTWTWLKCSHDFLQLRYSQRAIQTTAISIERDFEEFGRPINGLKRWIEALANLRRRSYHGKGPYSEISEHRDLFLKRFRNYPKSGLFPAQKSGKKVDVERVEECKEVKKWAVVTSIGKAPSKAMNVTLETGWCVVVVGDEKSPGKFPAPGNKR